MDIRVILAMGTLLCLVVFQVGLFIGLIMNIVDMFRRKENPYLERDVRFALYDEEEF